MKENEKANSFDFFILLCHYNLLKYNNKSTYVNSCYDNDNLKKKLYSKICFSKSPLTLTALMLLSSVYFFSHTIRFVYFVKYMSHFLH